MENNIVLEVHNLCKYFGSGKNLVKAVDNISFNIKSNEIISIIGESGSGKTTTAKMLLKLLPSTKGRIIFKGRDITNLKDRKSLIEYWKEVQAVFQDPFSSFNAFYTVKRLLKNVFKLLPPIDEDKKEELIKHALTNVGLNYEEILNKRPFELSGGQKQRIMIARILIIKPTLLIADEPTSMIDASSRTGILNLLLDLRKNYGMSIIFITHDIGLACYTSDRLIIMSEGKIVETGEPEEILVKPKSSYTQKLLKDVPVIHTSWEF
ncbi:MAG: ABC transporter ATP-binding protein [Dictyoglomaceae bacterium]|nr:ABC transporter ATP-binding protein [Dictyoglomaceae bacterium]